MRRFDPGNILFLVAGDTRRDVPLQSGEWCPVKWLGGVQVDDSALGYLITSQMEGRALNDADYSTLTVKIADLCGGKLNSNSS